jgi:TetR/AcrR family transcriptional repressor of nem operon
MRYDGGRRQRTRDKVLRAGADMIRADGPGRLSVAGVMASAGLTQGGFYAHFGSRADFIAEAIEMMFQQNQEELLAELADADGEAGLSAYIDFYLSPRHRDMRTAGCPIASLLGEVQRLPGPARRRIARGVTELVDRLAEHLRRLGCSAPADDAGALLAELVGVIALARAEPDLAVSNALLERHRRRLKQRLSLPSTAPTPPS